MEKFFERILDDDEKIEKIVRPNKCKYFFSNLILWGITFALFTITGLIGVIAEDYKAIYILIPIGVWVVLMLFAWLFMAIYYIGKSQREIKL